MKNTILPILATIIFFITSCENPKIAELNNRLIELEKQNVNLIDSLNKIEKERLFATQLIGIPAKSKLTSGQPNEFRFYFQTLQEFPEYNLYRVYSDDERELIYENHTKSTFEYNFTPKNDKNTSFKLLAIFDLDSVTLYIPAKIEMEQ